MGEVQRCVAMERDSVGMQAANGSPWQWYGLTIELVCMHMDTRMVAGNVASA